jgi:hypothetical protein
MQMEKLHFQPKVTAKNALFPRYTAGPALASGFVRPGEDEQKGSRTGTKEDVLLFAPFAPLRDPLP